MSAGDPNDGAAPLLGHVVAERYFVEELIGEGGMGTVYRARHLHLEKKVALKVLHREYSRKPELVERFLQEARAASRIRNQHVIDITDFGVTAEGYVFFAMEYLEGRDLHALLKEVVDGGSLLPWKRSRSIFLQVCSALSAAHHHGIVHRDLKPENIFLVAGAGHQDYVKLLDFGIAKVQSDSGERVDEDDRKLTKTGMLFGTPEYMAPEQARGEPADHRVDVYAMGCLLFQFLVGTVPFRAESFMAVLTQHMVDPVPEIGSELLAQSGAPEAILPVLRRALEKDRELRYASIEELAEAVRNSSQAHSVAETLPTPPSEPPSEPRRKRPTTRSVENWKGSVRDLEDLLEEEEAQRHASKSPARARWIASAVLLIAGGGVSAAALLGNQGAMDPASSGVETTGDHRFEGQGTAQQQPAGSSPAPGPGRAEPGAATDAGVARAARRPAPPRDSRATALPMPARRDAQPASVPPPDADVSTATNAPAPASPIDAASEAAAEDPVDSDEAVAPDPLEDVEIKGFPEVDPS